MGKGGLTIQKPSRSDEILEAQQQLQIAEQIKSHFESLAPKRHRKPLRSESSDDYLDVQDDLCDDIPPELQKYQELKSRYGVTILFCSAIAFSVFGPRLSLWASFSIGGKKTNQFTMRCLRCVCGRRLITYNEMLILLRDAFALPLISGFILSLFVSKNGERLPEEFVETDYYNDLNAIDKVHCPPGEAFIKLDCNGGSYFRLAYQEDTGVVERIPVRSNPATNDWFPAPVDDHSTVMPVSSKPVRSG